LVGGPASAATVTYQSAENDPKVQLTIDEIAGGFRFSLSTLFGAADYLGLGFDFAGASLSQNNLQLVSYTPGNANTPSLVLYGNNTNSQVDCGQGCNFNGAGSDPTPYDYIIRIGENGGGANAVFSAVFDILTPGTLANNPFSLFGVRAQGTSGPSSSIKVGLIPVAPVPLPATGVLLLGALAAFGFAKRRKAV
jgi:hypothetical protein